MTVQRDEFHERARLAAEGQELARDYAAGLLRMTRKSFALAAGCLLLMLLAWWLAGPKFNHHGAPPTPLPPHATGLPRGY